MAAAHGSVCLQGHSPSPHTFRAPPLSGLPLLLESLEAVGPAAVVRGAIMGSHFLSLNTILDSVHPKHPVLTHFLSERHRASSLDLNPDHQVPVRSGVWSHISECARNMLGWPGPHRDPLPSNASNAARWWLICAPTGSWARISKYLEATLP